MRRACSAFRGIAANVATHHTTINICIIKRSLIIQARRRAGATEQRVATRISGTQRTQVSTLSWSHSTSSASRNVSPLVMDVVRMW